MRKALTDTFCKSTPAAFLEGRSEWADMRCVGLEFRVTSAGARSWTFQFRDPTPAEPFAPASAPIRKSGLLAARKKADDLRAKVAAWGQPDRRASGESEAESQSRTFKTLAERYMAEHARRHKRPRSVEEDARNLNKHVLPKWG